MSGFSDYSTMAERRRAELQQRRRRRLAVTGASASVVLLLVVGCVAAVSYNGRLGSHSAGPVTTHDMHATSKSVAMICSSTDYAKTCESSLSKVVNNGSNDPKELVKAAVSVVADEIKKAFEHSNLINSSDPRVKGAIQDCMQLYIDSKDELASALKDIISHGLEQLPKKSHDLRNWLAAVMSYQETCIDGFPEGELKTKMRAGMKTAKELTSNALAIIGHAASFFSSIKIPALNRRLLAEGPALNVDGYPAWMSGAERRILKTIVWKKPTPNVTVAKDGSGDFSNITAALAALPDNYEGRYVIYVKQGVYDEIVNVTKKMVNITMYGDGSKKSIITGNQNFIDGTKTCLTATFVALGDGFMAYGMGFRNTAGPAKHQAVALRVQSDRAVFFNCRMEGYQDTLYAQTHRQYYRGCIITGTVDFIFGDSSSIFQNCVIVVRRPLDNQQNIVTAHGRSDRHEPTGFVIQHCRIIGEKSLTATSANATAIRSYLARPWKEFSRTVIMESFIDGFIHPDGYMPWEGDFGLSTLFYAEYGNTGAGANVTNRVKWPGVKVLKNEEALTYTVATFLEAGDWIPATGTPVRLGLYS